MRFLPLSLVLLGLSSSLAAVPPLPVPPENPITPAKAVLGKILFWDEQLSSDDTVACGTCHLPEFAGGDARPAVNPGDDGVTPSADDVFGSLGVIGMDTATEYVSTPPFGFEPQVTGRSTPGFMSTLYAPRQFWDGRAGPQFEDPETGALLIPNNGGLEAQAVAPILSEVEMGHAGRDWPQVIAKLQRVVPLELGSDFPPDVAAALAANPTYADLFEAAFGDPAITAARIGLALATYERTLNPDQTPFDEFSDGNPAAFTPQQVQGFAIFRGTACADCHRPPTFTDDLFHVIGMRPPAEDPGLAEVTLNPADRGKFKTPGLRNVGLRQQFMHTGTLTSLEEVFDHYTDVSQQFPDNKDFRLPVTGLTQTDIDAMIAFLRDGLTDPRAAAGVFPFDRPEMHATADACRDGIDNDGDGRVDAGDIGCVSGGDTSEHAHTIGCDDGLDNDRDGLKDGLDDDCDFGAFELLVDPLSPGAFADVTFQGVPPGRRVYLMASTRGPGVGPCPAPGVCLDLVQPTLVGSAVAGDDGIAVLNIRVPPAIPVGRTVWFQAGWARLGTGATSEVASVVIQ